MLKYTYNGHLIKTLGKYGAGNGEFNIPNGVRVDSSGNVFVCETYDCRIQKFDNNGAFISKWSGSGIQ